MKKLIIGGCCKNVGRFLPTVLKNIDQLRTLFTDVKIIMAHDRSSDDTLVKLEYYYYKNMEDVKILLNNNQSKIRTVNIAGARNSIMSYVRKNHPDYDLLCFMDMDDIIDKPFNLSVFEKAIGLYDQWDALSFNRSRYYDIFALRYDEYTRPCWSWGKDSIDVVVHSQGDIAKRLGALRDDELMPVLSAFNGIALFKLDKFLNCHFNGLYHPPSQIYPMMGFTHIPPVDDCEWVNWHDCARTIYPDLRVMISPMKPY